LAETFLTDGLIEGLGWALVHSVWQCALVALAYASFAALAARASAQTHYLAGCAALLLMLALPAATVYVNLNSAAPPSPAERAADFAHAPDEGQTRAHAPAGGESAPPAQAPEGRAEGARGPARLRSWAARSVASFAPWLVSLWLSGVMLVAARSCGGWLAVRRLRLSAEPVGEEFERMFARLAARLRATPAARLCRSALVEVPTVVGHLRPVVLVPLSALAGLTPQQLEAVLAHELAHVRRRDFLVNLLQTAVETLLFYHPTVWWVSRRVRAEREHACDDAAVEAAGDALLYARALAEMEALRQTAGRAPALALAADGGSLMQRINRLVRPQTIRRPRAQLAAASLILVSFFVACGAAAGARAIVPADAAAAGDSAAPPAAAPPDRRVAITFVNFPGNNVHDNRRLVAKTRQLIRGLAAHDAKAVAFVNEGTLYRDGAPDEERVGLLREWLDAGHELGNETYGHTSLYRVSLEEFKADVERGERLMSKLLAERGGRLRWFSYPYLNTGSDLAEKTAAEKYLAARGYRVHPVTVDNMDWLFSRAYLEALRAGDERAAERVRAEYVPYMERMFEFVEAYSREVVGREFPQVLMLTGGPLNADALGDLLAMLKRRGYSFVTMEEATRDEAYSLPDTYTGARGDSWIARWAVTKGLEYKDSEENLPPFMQNYFEEFLAKQRAKK
jgi:beta-lactamase regulating signal transducer with metallopeptidase domain